jgi:pimeloyl-ACP methyl ester carboxylesterase
MIVQQVGDLIAEIARRGVAILLVEQKLSIAMRISHRVYVMGHGRIVFEGTPAELDVGLSTKFDAAPPIDVGAALERVMAGEKINPPYDLTDMAADTVGLMDRLAIKKAHIVGASMGGMIAQIVAAKYPDRVRSLVSIMSSSGDPGLPQALPEAMAAIMQARPDGSDRELAVQHGMRIYRAIGSPGFPTPDDELRIKVGAAFDRSYYPVGVGRQFAAIMATGSRVDMLKKLSVPTLVLHGADDPLVPVEAGRHTAAQIPGSTLTVIPGMGHDIATGPYSHSR